MIKKNLFKNLILSASIVSSVVMVGCATNNVATNDTEVSVEIADVAEAIEALNAEETSEKSNTSATEETLTDSESTISNNLDGTELTSANNKATSVTGGSNVTGGANDGFVASKDGNVTVANNDSSVASNGKVKVDGAKPAGVPSNVPSSVPSSVATPKPAVNGNAESKVTTTKQNATMGSNDESKSSTSITTKTKTEGSGNHRYNGVDYASEEEMMAAIQKHHDDYINGLTTTVTVNNEVTELISDKRESKGQNRLETSDELNEIAKKRAEEIASDFSHNSASGTGTGSEIIQGSIGGGQSAQDTVNNYDESVMHGAQMGDDRNASAGSATATVTDSDGNVVAQYDVTVFDSDDDSGITWEVYDPISGNGPTE